jgi:hypothetical protein
MTGGWGKSVLVYIVLSVSPVHQTTDLHDSHSRVTVKYSYGHVFHGIGTKNDSAGEVQQEFTRSDPTRPHPSTPMSHNVSQKLIMIADKCEYKICSFCEGN